MVIHEVLREEGETELKREPAALAWSGFAAGLSMGFSFLGLALVHSALPEAPWTRLVDSIGYTVGFLITILGRQALFTESTLTAVLPILVRRDREPWGPPLNSGSWCCPAIWWARWCSRAFISIHGLFPDEVHRSLVSFAHAGVSGAFWPTFSKAILAGWLIAVMVWLLPSAGSSKILVIMFLTYIVGIGRFSHVVAGSVDSAFAVFSGGASMRDYFLVVSSFRRWWATPSAASRWWRSSTTRRWRLRSRRLPRTRRSGSETGGTTYGLCVCRRRARPPHAETVHQRVTRNDERVQKRQEHAFAMMELDAQGHAKDPTQIPTTPIQAMNDNESRV